VRCSRQRRREGRGGVVADIAKLSVGREEYYTRVPVKNVRVHSLRGGRPVSDVAGDGAGSG
jgi:hypothetical protein